MKIAICGSISFAKEMLDTRKQLEKLGHIVITPEKITKYADKTSAIEDKWDKIEHDVFKTYFEKIKKVDCVLIINKDKNNIKNYIITLFKDSLKKSTEYLMQINNNNTKKHKILILKSKINYNISYFIYRIVETSMYDITLKNEIRNEINKIKESYLDIIKKKLK